jgi:glycosyltransferase involved in cell wall biosynthesis
VRSERITVVPNAIDPAVFQHLPRRDEAKARFGLSGKLVLGFTGFVREWDRLDRIVRWMASHRGSQSLHLFIVGDGPARGGIEACAAALGVQDQVSFTGVVPREKVPVAAKSFDIALQTALVPYASPLCLFEYLAMGVAIVAPDQPNHHEILEHGKSALLYDVNDPAGLEDCIEALCLDESLRESIAAAGPAVISEKRFTWRDNASTVCDLAGTISP